MAKRAAFASFSALKAASSEGAVGLMNTIRRRKCIVTSFNLLFPSSVSSGLLNARRYNLAKLFSKSYSNSFSSTCSYSSSLSDSNFSKSSANSSSPDPIPVDKQLEYRRRLRAYIHPFVLRHLDLSFSDKGIGQLNEIVISRLNTIATCPIQYLFKPLELFDLGRRDSRWDLAVSTTFKDAILSAKSQPELMHLISSFYLIMPPDQDSWQFLDNYCIDILNSSSVDLDLSFLISHSFIAAENRFRSEGTFFHFKVIDHIYRMLSKGVGKVSVNGDFLHVILDLYNPPLSLKPVKLEHFEKLSIALQIADRCLAHQKSSEVKNFSSSSSSPVAFAKAVINTVMTQIVSRSNANLLLEVGLLKHFWSIRPSLANFTGYVYYKTIFDVLYGATKRNRGSVSLNTSSTNSNSNSNSNIDDVISRNAIENMHQLSQIHVLRSLFMCMSKNKVIHSALVDEITFCIDNLPPTAIDSLAGSIGILMFQRLTPLGISDRSLSSISKLLLKAVSRANADFDSDIEAMQLKGAERIPMFAADYGGTSDQIVNNLDSGSVVGNRFSDSNHMIEEARHNRKLLQSLGFSSESKDKIKSILQSSDRKLTPSDASLALLVFRMEPRDSPHYLLMQAVTTYVAKNASLFGATSLCDMVRTMAFCGYNNQYVLQQLDTPLEAAISSRLNIDQRRALLYSFSKLSYTPSYLPALTQLAILQNQPAITDVATLKSTNSSKSSSDSSNPGLSNQQHQHQHREMRSASALLWALAAARGPVFTYALFQLTMQMPIMKSFGFDAIDEANCAEGSLKKKSFRGPLSDIVTLFQFVLEVKILSSRDKWPFNSSEKQFIDGFWNKIVGMKLYNNHVHAINNSSNNLSNSWMHQNASFYLNQLGWRHTNEAILNSAYSADIFFDISDVVKFSNPTSYSSSSYSSSPSSPSSPSSLSSTLDINSVLRSRSFSEQDFVALERKYKELVNPNNHWQIIGESKLINTCTDSNSSSNSFPQLVSQSIGLVFEMDGPSHFGSYVQLPLGHSRLKRNQLENLGYIVVSIPHWLYNQAMSPSLRVAILVDTMTLAKEYAVRGKPNFVLRP